MNQAMQSTPTNQPQEHLTIDDLSQLLDVLEPVAHKCIFIGLQLGVSDNVIRNIRPQYHDNQNWLYEILRYRLNQKPVLTWHCIVQALQSPSVKEKLLASEIERQYILHSSESASPQIAYACTYPASSPYIHHSTSQPNCPVTKPQLHPHPGWNSTVSQIPAGVDNTPSQPPQPLYLQQYLPQHSLINQHPNFPTPTPSQPQAETIQPLSSFQPSSSQFMSVPATSQAMLGPSPQLNKNAYIPHHLQGMCSEQQVLHREPLQQHIPRHEPQTMPQLYATGSVSKPPMDAYVRFVKATYRSREVENDTKATKWPTTPSKVYINLVSIDQATHVSKEEADECTKIMVACGSVDAILKKKTQIDFSDIGKNIPASGKKVIVVNGAPGVGKTSFAWEFCRRWEQGEIAQQYQLVLLLRLRDERMSKAQSLGDLIHHPLKTLGQAVENELITTLGDHTLILLEGFDELPDKCRAESSIFLQLIDGLLPHATVLVTSRPWATQNVLENYSHRIFQHIEILGFTGELIKEYVKSVFVEEEAKEVMSYIDKFPQIKACMYIPLNLAIVVKVYQESKAGMCSLPKTLTELYYTLIKTLLLRYLYGHPVYSQNILKIHSLRDLPPDVYSKLLDISKLAYMGICVDWSTTVQLIYSNLPSEFETLGLMQSVPQLYVAQGEDMSYNFLHLTIQEFLAALYISNMSPDKQLEHSQRHWGRRLEVVLKFLAGLTKLDHLSPDCLRNLLLDKDYFNEKRFRIAAPVLVNSRSVTWMFETQRDDIVPIVLQEKTVEFRDRGLLSALDCYSLGYCIAHSQSQWLLSLTRCEMEEAVKMLVAGTSTSDVSGARVVGLRVGDKSGDCYYPLRVDKGLDLLFSGLKGSIQLKELYLDIVGDYSNIAWSCLSRLQVLHLVMRSERNWRLSTSLLHLPLESLTIEIMKDGRLLELEENITIILLLLYSKSLKHMDIKDLKYPITAEVAVGQHTHEQQLQNSASSETEKKYAEFMRCRLHPGLLGLIIAYSHFQWVLTFEWQSELAVFEWQRKPVVEEAIRMLVAGASTRPDTSARVEEAVRMLVAGVSTRPDTGARVVGLRAGQRNKYGVDFFSTPISTEGLNTLFSGMKNYTQLEKLHIVLPEECSKIKWPCLSKLRVLHLELQSTRNWRLNTLLPCLSLESLTIGYESDLAPDDVTSIGKLLSSSHCPKYMDITGKKCPITAEVDVSPHAEKENEFIRCCLDCYSLGYLIACSHFCWVLTVESNIKEEEVKMLVEGVNTRCNTEARVVGLRGGRNRVSGEGYWHLFISPEFLSVLFTGLQDVFQLQELHLYLPEHCRIAWPNLCKLQVLHLLIGDRRAWNMKGCHTDKATMCCSGVGLEYYVAIGQLLLSSNCLQCLQYECCLSDNLTFCDQLMESISSKPIPLRSLKFECTFSDSAVHHLALFIINSTTLNHLSLVECKFSVCGLLELAQAINQSSSLKKTSLNLEGLIHTVDGDDEARDFVQILVHYPFMVANPIVREWSHITDKGAQAVATALSHNCTLWKLNLSDNSIGDTGSAALAEGLHHNSTLTDLHLSHNCITVTGSAAIAKALCHNSTLELLDMSKNSLGCAGSAALAQALHCSNLWGLNLSSNSISDTGSAALAQALHHNSTLEQLDLSNNEIGDTGSAALAQALQHNSTLKNLVLSHNKISDTGSAALSKALCHNFTIKGLNLSDNDAISEKGFHDLVHALTMNTSITGMRYFLCLPRKCEVYATHSPQYVTVERRIRFM